MHEASLLLMRDTNYVRVLVSSHVLLLITLSVHGVLGILLQNHTQWRAKEGEDRALAAVIHLVSI